MTLPALGSSLRRYRLASGRYGSGTSQNTVLPIAIPGQQHTQVSLWEELFRQASIYMACLLYTSPSPRD